jgi:outer membrane lipoprotein carrier protein
MKILLKVILFIFIVFFYVRAGYAKTQDPVSAITSIYRNAKLVEINVEKTISSEWKAKDTTYTGRIFYSQGRFRWENDTPEKTWTLYNGSKLWNVQFASPDFPGKNKVTVTKINKKTRGQILLMSLLDVERLSDKFNVKVKKQSGHELSVQLEPKEPDPSVNDLHLTVDTEKKRLRGLSFKDDLGNLTKIKFGESVFKKKKQNGLFNFSPGKDDEVTNI